MPIDAAILRGVNLFELLDDSELEELAAHIDEAHFTAKQMLFKKGDPGDNMHIVLKGKIETYVYDSDSNRISLATVNEGGIVGELSLLDTQPRSANAVALEDTNTFIIDQDDLQRLFSRKPAAALDILRVLGQRIRATNELLIGSAARNANEEIEERLTIGQRVADEVARFGGSWNFITLFGVILLVWIVLNTWVLATSFDPPPYIGLNLILSMLAALQAPVIMMSQNRQDAKDRIRSELDYKVNLRAELEIKELNEKVDHLQEELRQVLGQATQILKRTTGTDGKN